MRPDRLHAIRRLVRRTAAPARDLRHAASDLLFYVDALRAEAGKKVEPEPPPPKTKPPEGACKRCHYSGVWKERNDQPGYYSCRHCVASAFEETLVQGEPVE